MESTEKEISRLSSSMIVTAQKDYEMYLNGLGKNVSLVYESTVKNKIKKGSINDPFKRVKDARRFASQFAKSKFSKDSNVSQIRFSVLRGDGSEIENFTLKSVY